MIHTEMNGPSQNHIVVGVYIVLFSVANWITTAITYNDPAGPRIFWSVLGDIAVLFYGERLRSWVHSFFFDEAAPPKDF